MMNPKRIFLLLVLGVCLAVAGCGSDEEGAPIPADQAAALDRELNSIEARVRQGSVGACEDVFRHPTDPNQRPVEDILASLPSDVDQDVRDALEQSFANLWSLVERECEDKAAEQEEQQPEPTPQPEETTTETAPPETETTPPETDTQPTSPEEQILPPDGDGENGGEIPEGEGNGNGGGVGPGSAKKKNKEEKE